MSSTLPQAGGRHCALPREARRIAPGSDEHKRLLDLGPAGLLELCLAEQHRRLGVYDRRLLRPAAVAAGARQVRRLTTWLKRA